MKGDNMLDEFLTCLFKESILIGVCYAGVIAGMIIDFVFGVRKAKLLGEATTSTGFKRTADKARKYFSPMLVLTVIDIMLCTHLSFPAFTMLWACYCVLCEFKSVTEKSWQKKELRDAANTVSVIIKNKEDIAKLLLELTKEKEEKENE